MLGGGGGGRRREAAPNQTLGCACSRNGPLVWKTGQPSSYDFPPVSSRCLLKAIRQAKGRRGAGRWISGDSSPLQSLQSSAREG